MSAAAALIRDVQKSVPRFAVTGFVGSVHEARLLAEARTLFLRRPLESGAQAMVMPFSSADYDHLLVVDPRADPAEMYFRVWHEIAHILRGEASQMVFLAAEDIDSHSERVADLFALSDLIPTREMRLLRKRLQSATRVAAELRAYIGGFLPAWPAERVRDRARLRVLLYRTQGI